MPAGRSTVLMEPHEVDPTDVRVLERNYDYAQQKVHIHSMLMLNSIQRLHTPNRGSNQHKSR